MKIRIVTFCFLMLLHSCTSIEKTDWSKSPITEKEIYEVVNFAIAEQGMNKSNYLDLHASNFNDNFNLDDFMIGRSDSFFTEKTEIPKWLSAEDVNYMNYQLKSRQNFVWDNYKLKFEQMESKLRYHISLPLFAKDKKTAIIFTENSGEILGTLTIMMLARNGNKWIKRASHKQPYRAYRTPYGIEAMRQKSSSLN